MEVKEIKDDEDLSLTSERTYIRLVEGKREDPPKTKGSTFKEAKGLVTKPDLRKQVEEGSIIEARMELEKIDYYKYLIC